MNDGLFIPSYFDASPAYEAHGCPQRAESNPFHQKPVFRK
jgi:hypothetical protein